MSTIVSFPRCFVIVDGGWINGYPVGGPDGQIFFVIYHMEDGSELVIWDGNSHDEAMREATEVATNEGLHVFDKTGRAH